MSRKKSSEAPTGTPANRQQGEPNAQRRKTIEQDRHPSVSKPVILMVEDDLGRIADAKRWLPADMRLLCAHAEGVALGTVEHSGDEDFAGIALDYNLKDELYDLDKKIGRTVEVARRIVQRISKDTPILVHSMNNMDRYDIVSILRYGGFTVTQIPWWEMTEEKFHEWLDTCRDVWRERKGT